MYSTYCVSVQRREKEEVCWKEGKFLLEQIFHHTRKCFGKEREKVMCSPVWTEQEGGAVVVSAK